MERLSIWGRKIISDNSGLVPQQGGADTRGREKLARLHPFSRPLSMAIKV